MKHFKAHITQASSSVSSFGKRDTTLSLKVVDDFKVVEEMIRGQHSEPVYVSTEPPVSVKPSLDIKKGDKIRYQFIRKNGSNPEVSVWMKVKYIDGDLITTDNTGPYGTYEFRVLRCQVVEHLPKKTKVREQVEADPEVPVENKELVIAATERHFSKIEDNSIKNLRKRIEEFNLT